MKSQRFTFRLKPDRDQDLITWLESLGEGERSFFIRQALRMALKNKVISSGNVIDLPMLETPIMNSPTAINLIPVCCSTPEPPENPEDMEGKLDKFTSIF